MVDYSSLENYRTERYRGFESLSLRNLKRKKFVLNFFLFLLARLEPGQCPALTILLEVLYQ